MSPETLAEGVQRLAPIQHGLDKLLDPAPASWSVQAQYTTYKIQHDPHTIVMLAISKLGAGRLTCRKTRMVGLSPPTQCLIREVCFPATTAGAGTPTWLRSAQWVIARLSAMTSSLHLCALTKSSANLVQAHTHNSFKNLTRHCKIGAPNLVTLSRKTFKNAKAAKNLLNN